MTTDDLTPLPPEAPWQLRWLADNRGTISKQASTWFIWLMGILASAGELIPLLFPKADDVADPYIHKAIIVSSICAWASKYLKQNPSP